MTPEPQSDGMMTVTTYAGLDRFIQAFAAGSLNLLVLVGPPGLQKSRLARDALADACWIEGHATAFGIYKRLWEYRDRPIVIDDVDSIYKDKAAVRLLKALCQTDARKAVAWESDARSLDRENIPKRFTTSSHVLLIANDWRSLNVHVSALEDRGHLVRFEPDALEVHRRVAGWFWDQEVYDWIASHLHLLPRPSMRLYRAAWELKEAGLDWKAALLDRWLHGTRLLVARLKADPSFATEEDRARAFAERGGGCRATYFNHARLLQPEVEVPKLVLTCPPPGPAEEPLDVLGLLRRRHGDFGNG